jgi:O-methyltransferase domain
MPLRALPEDRLDTVVIKPVSPLDPLTRTMHSLAVARCLGVVARLGLFSELAGAPVELTDLAQRFALRADPLRMMLDVLAGERYLQCHDGAYSIAPAARQWLDPAAPTSVTIALSHTLDHWAWWAELQQVAAGGALATTKPDADDEGGWLRRVRSKSEYARRIAGEMVDLIDLSHRARSVLELGSAHGAYSAELCRRNPMLRSTLVDQSAAINIGRELMWEAGMERVVSHRAGDIFTADLGGPHDAVFCTPLMMGLDHDQVRTLLARVRRVLPPGGLLITLRWSAGSAASAAGVGAGPRFASGPLLSRLASWADPSSPEQFEAELGAAGFGAPRVHRLSTAPELSLYVADAV